MPYKFAIGTVALISVYTALRSIINQPHSDFKNYTLTHAKNYHGDQYVYRYNIYKQSLERVKQHNKRAQKGEESYYLGINMFSDMPMQQFADKYLQNDLSIINQQSNYVCAGAQPVVKDMPENFDWSNRSAVTGVRKVSACSKAAYAIVTAETIQSGRFITTGRLSQASPQQIIDCSNSTGNNGCTSGNILNSFEYILKSGITSQAKYSFTDKSDACSYRISQKQWQILGCVKVNPQNETLIRAAVVRQPIAAAINATLTKFRDYKSGIFEITGVLQSCKSSPSHYITIVGYGYDASSKKKYWKLKNSWGTTWGMDGYMTIVRNGDGQGECGVQNEIYYPLD